MIIRVRGRGGFRVLRPHSGLGGSGCGRATDQDHVYGAVLDSEASKVEVGECAIVCENAVLRATSAGGADLPVVVGDNAVVGPHATLLGGVVEPACYVATGATVLP